MYKAGNTNAYRVLIDCEHGDSDININNHININILTLILIYSCERAFIICRSILTFTIDSNFRNAHIDIS